MQQKYCHARSAALQALAPPPRSTDATRCSAATRCSTHLRAAALPTEACVALLYVAPLPPVGTVIGRRWRRIRGAAVDTGPLVAPPRDKTTRTICATRSCICATCRRTALESVFLLRRLATLRHCRGTARRPTSGRPTPVVSTRRRRRGCGLAHGRVCAQSPRDPGRAGPPHAQKKRMQTIPGAMDPAGGPGPRLPRVLRAGARAHGEFLDERYFNRNPERHREPAPKRTSNTTDRGDGVLVGSTPRGP